MVRRPRLPRARIEEIIAPLAARQHGVVSRRQLLDAGVPSGLIDRRVASRELQCLHRGVYRVGPVTSPRAPEMAACLACGPSAVLSHRSAGTVWRLLYQRERAVVDVTVTKGRRVRPGIRVRRSGTLREDETTVRERLPITTPTRTLVDLAGVLRPRTLEQALATALDEGLTSLEELGRNVDRHAGREGVRHLAELVRKGSPRLTRSEAEERFLRMMRRACLDPPRTNTEVEGYEVDFLWPAAGLVVEIDGVAFHSSPRAFERDRRRDAVLAAADVRVLRVTWRQIVEEPEAVIGRVAAVLAVATRGGARR